jgi:hypothetical protein
MDNNIQVSQDLWYAYQNFRYELSLLSHQQLEVLKRLHHENDDEKIKKILETLKYFTLAA